MRAKKAVTLVNDALAAMSRGGKTLSRTELLELHMAFGALQPEQLPLPPVAEDVSAIDPEAWIKSELRRLKGNTADFMPYLVAALSAKPSSVTFAKTDCATLKSAMAKAYLSLSRDQTLTGAKAALNAYRADYDTSYKLKTA